MQCFHWAAERLKGTPLWADEEPLQTFETEDEGALYNDFTEKQAAELINVREIEQLEFSQDEQHRCQCKHADRRHPSG